MHLTPTRVHIPMTRILSIDVGIKNLSYCYFHAESNDCKIVQWDNVCVTEQNCKNAKIEDLTEQLLLTLTETFDSEFHADVVLIENQPMLKNGTMKTFSVVIYTYFNLLKLQFGNIKEVKFISATNKLKCAKVTEVEKDDKATYKDRKKLSIEVTKRYIDHLCPDRSVWFTGLSKKDDASDSLLQGIYYIEKVLGYTPIKAT